MIRIAENYAGIIDIKDRKYKIVIMLRVKPDAIRHCRENNNYWILNGTSDENMPYRIYLKKFNLFLFIINQKNKLLYLLKIYIKI